MAKHVAKVVPDVYQVVHQISGGKKYLGIMEDKWGSFPKWALESSDGCQLCQREEGEWRGLSWLLNRDISPGAWDTHRFTQAGNHH